MTRPSVALGAAAVLALAPLVPAQATDDPAKAPDQRTLTRTVDAVVIPGAVLGPKMQGAHLGRLRVYAVRNGVPVPIVHQFDERDPNGLYCYDKGDLDRRTRDVDGGHLDANDELVVLAKDAGDRLAPERYALVPGHTAAQELELRDPLDGGRGWIYVFRFDAPSIPPGRSSVDLVSLNMRKHGDEEKTYTWRSASWTFNNDKSRMNAVRATYASFLDERGLPGPNILDSTIVRAVVSFMWVEVVRQSNDIRVEIGGYIDGPLRVVAENRLKVYLALGLWASAPDSYVILWPHKVSMPTNASCPVNLDESGESSYTLTMDLARSAAGWKFFNSNNKTPVDIDGRTSPEEAALDRSWPEWNCMFGPHGAIISKFVIPQGMRRPTNQLFYKDDLTHRWPDNATQQIEFEPGAWGTNGYYVDMRGLAKGIYPGDYVVWYAPPPFKPGDEVQYLNEWDHPLQVSATAP